ncbi:MAG TPA: thiamine pyrophosphate-dependent enzyme [Syntrophales bacterium]|nr:thiamine pyrophosphate-dependent enzyme [Syntrophales bacterium]HOL58550.1 thiamine pyrophosphate-dependent enzyme [Syntrophales bacterium]HPO34842.1 thiamine pyrophosphate-dependent enzyme [Syntrophales bacterium]
MSHLTDPKEGATYLVMGNEAIVRGALEAGVNVASGYPGTPSSEIIENLSKIAKERNIYVEWSANEKVALEVAAAASFAGLRALCAMKQNGVNVASDFLLHLVYSGTRGGIILVSCDDPGALSSVNEGESRYFARQLEMPLLEPGSFQEAKDMTKWAFDLSEELKQIVMVRSVTRMSHASGNITYGKLPAEQRKAAFKFKGFILDPNEGIITSAPVEWKHKDQQEKIKRAKEIFESSPFNTYEGPEKPELLIVTSSACYLYSKEAVDVLGVKDRVGILKLGTTWPLPPRLLAKHMASTDKILIVEEVIPFMEENVKVLAAEKASEIGVKKFYGKNEGLLPSVGEMNPDYVIAALSSILGINYVPVSPEYDQSAKLSAFVHAPARDQVFCPGCPHRASFFAIRRALELDGRDGFVCGDIGCYTMAVRPTGFETLKTVHSMGSGMGLASGFGKLGQFGMEQPVFAVCGDSTFYHAVIPALVNAVHNQSNATLVILDNGGTAMTGFQPHPGQDFNVMGDSVPAISMARICEAIGARVEIRNPFKLDDTLNTLIELMEEKNGVKVLILSQYCALSPQRRGKKDYELSVDETVCLGEECGCGRFCTRIFRCPGLIWNKEKGKAEIDQVICVGCGVCADICPKGAIKRKEVA